MVDKRSSRFSCNYIVGVGLGEYVSNGTHTHGGGIGLILPFTTEMVFETLTLPFSVFSLEDMSSDGILLIFESVSARLSASRSGA